MLQWLFSPKEREQNPELLIHAFAHSVEFLQQIHMCTSNTDVSSGYCDLIDAVMIIDKLPWIKCDEKQK